MTTGTCLCGVVSVTFDQPIGPIAACHCRQCRKLSGFYSASFDIAEADTNWAGSLSTFPTPGGGLRGFCPTCGTKLWFRSSDGAFSIEAGLIDGPTGAKLAEHIFTAEKGDFYDIADGVPQFPEWGEL